MSLKRLAREGVRTVNVLDLGLLEQIVGEAIERALRESASNGAAPNHAAQQAQLEVVKRLGGEAGLHRKGDELSTQSHLLERNLDELRRALAESQTALAKQSATHRRGAVEQLRGRLERSLTDAFAQASARVAPLAPDAAAALLAIQTPLRETLLSLLSAAVERSEPASSPSAAETEVELLQRRVKKVTAQLQETQELLDRIRRERGEEETSAPSARRRVQEPKVVESRVEQRRALMREVFEHNVELRRTLDGSANGRAASGPAAPPDREPQGP